MEYNVAVQTSTKTEPFISVFATEDTLIEVCVCLHGRIITGIDNFENALLALLIIVLILEIPVTNTAKHFFAVLESLILGFRPNVPKSYKGFLQSAREGMNNIIQHNLQQ